MEESGEVVGQGGNEMKEEGEGGVVEAKPPKKIPLPQWLLKALGPSSPAARKAAAIP